jgi:hypothetical protein
MKQSLKIPQVWNIQKILEKFLNKNKNENNIFYLYTIRQVYWTD